VSEISQLASDIGADYTWRVGHLHVDGVVSMPWVSLIRHCYFLRCAVFAFFLALLVDRDQEIAV